MVNEYIPCVLCTKLLVGHTKSICLWSLETRGQLNQACDFFTPIPRVSNSELRRIAESALRSVTEAASGRSPENTFILKG